MKILYVVTEEAVYRHRVMGVFEEFVHAVHHAGSICDGEDGHHNYTVSSITLNERVDDLQSIGKFSRTRTYIEGVRSLSSSEWSWGYDDTSKAIYGAGVNQALEERKLVALIDRP